MNNESALLLSNVHEVKELSGVGANDKYINDHLGLGWIIISHWLTDYGEPGTANQRPHFMLGWTRQNEPAKHPSNRNDGTPKHEEGF